MHVFGSKSRHRSETQVCHPQAGVVPREAPSGAAAMTRFHLIRMTFFAVQPSIQPKVHLNSRVNNTPRHRSTSHRRSAVCCSRRTPTEPLVGSLSPPCPPQPFHLQGQPPLRRHRRHCLGHPLPRRGRRLKTSPTLQSRSHRRPSRYRLCCRTRFRRRYRTTALRRPVHRQHRAPSHRPTA